MIEVRQKRNFDKKHLLFLIGLLCVGILTGVLVGLALTSPSVDVNSGAWDSVETTESEFLENAEKQEALDAAIVSDSDIVDNSIDISNVIAGYNRCKNNHKVGWIYFPGICDYPILWSGDNYYLNHTVDKKYSADGAIFCDANTASFFDGYTLIHGHHLRSGKMFTKLMNLKTASGIEANRYFYIYFGEGDTIMRYRVIAATLINGGKEVIPGDFNTDNEKREYLLSLISRSLVRCNYEDGELANAVVLHTCDYTFDNAHLLVVGVYETEVKNE